MGVNTPLATIESLRKNWQLAAGRTGVQFVEGLVPPHVLIWLLNDAERLNRLEARAIEGGFNSIERMLELAEEVLTLLNQRPTIEPGL